MNTLFVERSGACVGEGALVNEAALQKVRTALPASDRAKLHWMVGYVGNRLLAPDEIRDMGIWMDLLGHAREVKIDMAQIRSFIDSARGERFLQKHEVHTIAMDGEEEEESDFEEYETPRHTSYASAMKTNGRAKKSALVLPKTNGRHAAQSVSKNGMSSVIKIGATVKDLDLRRPRTGQILEVGAAQAKIKWDSGRVNEVSLERLKTPRLFQLH